MAAVYALLLIALAATAPAFHQGGNWRDILVSNAAQRRRIVLQESPSDDDLASAMAGATLLAHPTRADAFSLLVLEAWRAGVPTIVAAAGGPGRLVRHDRDGLIVPPGNPDALAAAILELSRNPDRAAALATAGQERWRHEGRWTTVFPHWRRLFEDVMDGRP